MALGTDIQERRDTLLPRSPAPVSSGTPRLLILLTVYALALGAYAIIRYNGISVDSDTALLTRAIGSVMAAGTVTPAEGAYGNGFGFPALATYVTYLTGVDVLSLQRLVFPLLIAGIVAPAYMFFREITRDSRAGLLATVLLFLQPDFLFVTLRGSHERFSIALMLTALYLLVRGYRLIEDFRAFTIHILLFYLVVFGVIESNTLYGASFIAALLASLGIGMLVIRTRVRDLFSTDYVLPRLIFPAAVSVALIFIQFFYLYPPSNVVLGIMRDAGIRLIALFVGVNLRSNPYLYIADTWIGTWIYFLLTAFNWSVLAVSFVIWVYWGYRWLVLRQPVVVRSHLLLWCLYFAFAVQIAVSIVVDYSGLLGGNLQLRVFPSFMLMAIPATALVLAPWMAALPARRWWRSGLVVLGSLMAVAAVVKATNEPLVSNKWMFPVQEEVTGLRWLDQYTRATLVWTDMDERLSMTALQLGMGTESLVRFGAFRVTPDVNYFFLSDTILTRAERRRVATPNVSDTHRVYDNGTAQVYQRRPVTPFQQ